MIESEAKGNFARNREFFSRSGRGKMYKCGGMKTLFQVQCQYSVRPSAGGPKWNIQLQVTPTIPAVLKRTPLRY
jgi:hypothetical protein